MPGSPQRLGVASHQARQQVIHQGFDVVAVVVFGALAIQGQLGVDVVVDGFGYRFHDRAAMGLYGLPGRLGGGYRYARVQLKGGYPPNTASHRHLRAALRRVRRGHPRRLKFKRTTGRR